MIRLTFFLLLSLPTIGAAQAGLSAQQVEQINALFGKFDRDGSPGYALGVVREGTLVFAQGYGRADLDNNVPITPRTSFHLASLSKQFTAAAMQPARVLRDERDVQAG
jgi:CubicO group peptidase (beta-lactamase class C family)